MGCYLGTISASSYDLVFIADRVEIVKLDLPAILRVLRPNGVLLMLQVTVQSGDSSKPVADSVISSLTLEGFIKVFLLLLLVIFLKIVNEQFLLCELAIFLMCIKFDSSN